MAAACRAEAAVRPTLPYPRATESVVGNLLMDSLATIDRVRDKTPEDSRSRFRRLLWGSDGPRTGLVLRGRSCAGGLRRPLGAGGQPTRPSARSTVISRATRVGFRRGGR